MKEQFCIFKYFLHQRCRVHDKGTPALFLPFSLKSIRDYFGRVCFSLRKEDITIMAQIIAIISMLMLATKHLYEFVAINTVGGGVCLK